MRSAADADHPTELFSFDVLIASRADSVASEYSYQVQIGSSNSEPARCTRRPPLLMIAPQRGERSFEWTDFIAAASMFDQKYRGSRANANADASLGNGKRRSGLDGRYARC